MRRAALGLLLLLPCAPAWAQAELFSCRVIVTGTDRRQHGEAWSRCLAQAVVKVTGRPGLADDPRLRPLLADAFALTDDFLYLDRMTDLPHRDEQGTRDRPYDLLVRFAAGPLSARLEALGLRVWTNRPTLQVRAEVAPDRAAPFALTADGDASERHRQALLAAAERFGLRVAVPAADRPRPREQERGAVLRGRLVWSAADFGWDADWVLEVDGAPAWAWSARGVSFDDAYRAGLGGAAERLSPR